MLAAGPQTRLAGVWARRPDAAARLADRHGAPAFDTYAELLDNCEAVAFSIAPEAQPALAVEAAKAGKAVLLEKPIAANVKEAEQLADAVGEAGVGSLVVLSYRFASGVRAFLQEAASFDAAGGRACFVAGGFLAGPFAASPWRQREGALLDLGPHAIDLLDTAVGPVAEITARRSPGDWVSLLLEHDSGAVTSLSLSGRAGIDPSRVTIELFNPTGVLEMNVQADAGSDAFETVRAEFAEVARTGGPHPCDVHRGLTLQRLIGRAESSLAAR
jgi:predicted dehydrogenase